MDNRFLLALAVTVVVETAVLVAAIRFLFNNRPLSRSRILFAGCFASSWSLPYLWFLIPRFVPGKAYTAVGECLVIVAEAAIFRAVLNLTFGRCVGLSLLCNIVSFAAGLVMVEVV
jgi:hypothetical protein